MVTKLCVFKHSPLVLKIAPTTTLNEKVVNLEQAELAGQVIHAQLRFTLARNTLSTNITTAHSYHLQCMYTQHTLKKAAVSFYRTEHEMVVCVTW